MNLSLMLNAMLLGLQHAFEPDHVAAVSVLATERRSRRATLARVAWRSSQWALGHGATLMLLSAAANVFRSSLPAQLSALVELWVIGPMMIGLGLMALRRAAIAHGRRGEPEATPGSDARDGTGATGSLPASRSFGVGMLHGAAGTGGALAVALGLAADGPAMALAILALEAIGVLLAMTVYALLLVFATRRLAGRSHALLQGVTVTVGVASIVVGVWWLASGFA